MNLLNVNILLVDDRPENLFSLESLIEGEGRTIFKANSGNEALKLVLKNDFGLILSDVQMPEMDGFEMVEIMRMNPKTKHIPVIFVTAINKEDKYIRRGYAEGAVDYLFKPLDADITCSKVDIFVELQRQKELLKIKNQELEEINTQKNHFLGMAAHDLRNPLGVIGLYSQFMLQSGDKLSAEHASIIQTILETTTYMSNLVNDLLDVTKIEAGKIEINLQEVDTKKFLKKNIAINELLAEDKGIGMVFNCLSDLPFIKVDAPKIEQVLNNLLSNAVKYSFPKTTININAEIKNSSLFVEIIDQGQGIPQDEIKSLFKPFQTTSVKSTSGEKSTGLGLMICAKIIESHGGEILVESEVGKGSKFTIVIPVTESKPAEVSQEQASKNSSAKKVLVVDDERINQIVMQKVLDKMGCKSVLAGNGAEAVSHLEQEEDIDLVLMDLHMPQLDGIEATKLILSHPNNRIKNTPIVGLTGTINEALIQSCLDAGMIKCITKPISTNDLITIIDTL